MNWRIIFGKSGNLLSLRYSGHYCENKKSCKFIFRCNVTHVQNISQMHFLFFKSTVLKENFINRIKKHY